jgi:hypothetical protein
MATMMRAARTIFSLNAHPGQTWLFLDISKFRGCEKSRVARFSTAASANAPGLANVDDVDTVRASLPEVRLHVDLEVLGTDVALLTTLVEEVGELRSRTNLSSEEHLNVLAGGSHGGRGVGGRHLDRYRNCRRVLVKGEGKRNTAKDGSRA